MRKGRVAKVTSTTRRGVAAGLLKEERGRFIALMEEGYREMAEEDRRLAEEMFPAVIEVMLRSTVWDEPSDQQN